MIDDLQTQLVTLIAKSAKIDPDALDPDADLFMDLGIDSLEGLKILAQLEDRHGILISDHELLNLNTLRKIRLAIERAKGPKEA